MTELKLKRNDLRNRKYYNEALEEETNSYGYRWLKVAALIPKNGGFLLVREAKVQDAAGEWHPGDGGWNLPAGRIEVGENALIAIEREIREESGYKVKLQEICQIGQSPKPTNPYTIITFLACPIAECADFNHDEIYEVRTFTTVEIDALEKAGKLRSPHLVMSAIENFANNIHAPLELLRIYT